MKTAIATREDKPMAKYIRAVEAAEKVAETFKVQMADLVDIFAEIPVADVAPVVRCKDCTHYDMGVCLKIYSDGNAHPEAWQKRKPEDFCSYGERKEGADNG